MNSQLRDCAQHVIRLPHTVPPILAMGAWFNNTLCLAVGDYAYLTHSVGNLDTPEACRAHAQLAQRLLDTLGAPVHAIAHDLHPDFYSSRLAAQLAAELNVPCMAVQHHHAHLAAVCVEHGIVQPVLGLALDGVGLGTDGTAWGGELLRVHGADCQRLGHLHPLALAGGDRAAQEPWRMAAAALHALGRNAEIVSRFGSQAAASTVATLLQRDIHCPRTSSMGRVFDAAAGLLGLCVVMQHDAQAAIALEQAATRYLQHHDAPPALAQGWHITATGQLDLLPTLAYLGEVADVERAAAIFHQTLVAALTEWVQYAAQKTGISTVALGGGCFFNQLLNAGLRVSLAATGLKLITAQAIPPNDTAIALGQAWLAAQNLKP